MQFVFLYDLLTHRLKRSQAHVQRDLGSLDSSIFQAHEDLGCEVQARGGCGYRSVFTGIDGLVPFAICKAVFSGNVGRQGNVTEFLDSFKEIRNRIKANSAFSEWFSSDHFCRELFCTEVSKEQPFPHADFPAWPDHALPFVRLPRNLFCH